MENTNIKEIINYFRKTYPEPKTNLYYTTPFQLLVAVILSAQSTDKQVNKVTKKIFNKYFTAEDFLLLNTQKLQNMIKSIGLYQNKSKYILKTAELVANNYNNIIPENRNELLKLPGIGRKSANVILAVLFNKNVIAVDTHVNRVSKRIGFASAEKLYDIEKEIENKIPKKLLKDMHHWLIFHGRKICKARNPNCEVCGIRHYCNEYLSNVRD